MAAKDQGSRRGSDFRDQKCPDILRPLSEYQGLNFRNSGHFGVPGVELKELRPLSGYQGLHSQDEGEVELGPWKMEDWLNQGGETEGQSL